MKEQTARITNSVQRNEAVPTNNEGKDRRVRTFVKPEGIYTVLLGKHFTPQPIDEIPNSIDAIAIESGNINWRSNIAEDVLSDLKSFPQYTKLLDTVPNSNIPILLPDSAANEVVNATYPILPVAELLAGTAIGFEVLMKTNKLVKNRHSEEYSRRDFLKLFGSAALAAWLLPTAVIENNRYKAIENDDYDGSAIETAQAFDKIHPEQKLLKTILVTARNVLLAHKEQFYMESTGNKPHIATIIGKAHAEENYDIKDAIMATPEERLEYLQSIQPLLKVGFWDSSFYKLGMITFDNNDQPEITVTEIPELKKLVSRN